MSKREEYYKDYFNQTDMPKTKIKASSKLIDIMGLPPGVKWTQEGNTITFSEPIFMEKQPTIKDILKELGDYVLETRDGEPDTVSMTPEFSELKQAIKSIRKENKRLKKQCELQTEGTIQIFDAAMKTLTNRIANPVAEFKCAKTNNPTKNGTYPCIINIPNGTPDWRISTYRDGYWNDKYIVAFTETEPGEIVNALKCNDETLWDKNNWGAGMDNKKYYLVNMGNNKDIAIDIEPEYYFQPEVMCRFSWTEITKGQYEKYLGN